AAELTRRYALLPNGASGSPAELPQLIAERARQQGRPVAAAVSLEWRTRDKLASSWVLTGLDYVAEPPAHEDSAFASERRRALFAVESTATRVWATRFERFEEGRDVRPSLDTMDDYAMGLLSCPRLSLLQSPTTPQVDSLASLCNRR